MSKIKENFTRDDGWLLGSTVIIIIYHKLINKNCPTHKNCVGFCMFYVVPCVLVKCACACIHICFVKSLNHLGTQDQPIIIIIIFTRKKFHQKNLHIHLTQRQQCIQFLLLNYLSSTLYCYVYYVLTIRNAHKEYRYTISSF